jgi:nicotinamide riboside transporter PnuC
MATWFLFTLVDVIAIKINLDKHLYPIVALYAFFIVLCMFGYRRWNDTLHVRSYVD